MGGPLTVECHSGYRYAERPTAIQWEGIHLPINEIISEAHTPHTHLFWVKVEDGRTLKLTYDELLDAWDILEEKHLV